MTYGKLLFNLESMALLAIKDASKICLPSTNAWHMHGGNQTPF